MDEDRQQRILLLQETFLNPLNWELTFAISAMFLLLLFSALISGSEVAFFSLNPNKWQEKDMSKRQEAIKKLLDKEIISNQKKIILVTSANHMNRAKKVFERKGLDVLAYPVDFKSSKGLNSLIKNPLLWMPNSVYLRKSSYALREFLGRIIYKAF